MKSKIISYEKNKNTLSKGITLIAIIITVIILLILVAVTLNMVMGENGIINKAKEAKEQTNFKTALEEVELIITEAKTDLIVQGNMEPTILELANHIQQTKKDILEMVIRYMPKAQVEVETKYVTENGVLGEIHHAEIDYKGYRFILDANLRIKKDETKKLGEIKKIKIIYDLKGGEGKFPEQEIEIGRKIEDKEPTKSGYAFLGWNTKEDGSGKTYKAGDVYEEEKDTILYANWSATQYKIIYNANGGQVSPESKTVKYNEEIGTLPTPTRTGYQFLGWYTKEDGDVQVKSDKIYTVLGDKEIYAKWQLITYTIKYDVNGGLGQIANQTKTYGQPLTLSNVKPTKKYNTFLGWSTDKNSKTATYSSGSSYTANNNVTLYAIWKVYPDVILVASGKNNYDWSWSNSYHTWSRRSFISKKYRKHNMCI